jgi:ABC-type multidrug transport system fused ATPase/permease subunit
MVASLQALSGVVPPLQRAAAGMARIQEVLDAPQQIGDIAGARPLPRFTRAIELRNVTFGYDDSPPTLIGVTTTIRAGESITIVGPSGSGKSTLLGLLLRLHDPTSGSIAIDGHDIRQVTQISLRTQIGVVFQESFLFDVTLRENIRLGKPEASDEEVEAAATTSLPRCRKGTTPAPEKGAAISRAANDSVSRWRARSSAGRRSSSSTSRRPRWTPRLKPTFTRRCTNWPRGAPSSP